MHPDIGHVTGVVTDTGVVAIIATSEEMENDNIPHGFLAILKDKTWKIFQEDMDLISITADKGTLARHVGYLAIDGRLAINEPAALLSIGETDIGLFDGKKWTRLKDPAINPK